MAMRYSGGIKPGRWAHAARHRSASSTPGVARAPVGQAGRQAEQAPQSRSTGWSGSTSASVITDPITAQGPIPPISTIVFLPHQPSPARTAAARSTRRLSSHKISARYLSAFKRQAMASSPRRRGSYPSPAVTLDTFPVGLFDCRSRSGEPDSGR
jgi:hypothetical protein